MEQDPEELVPITVLVPRWAADQIKGMAKKRRMPASVLVRQWLVERLEQRERRGRSEDAEGVVAD